MLRFLTIWILVVWRHPKTPFMCHHIYSNSELIIFILQYLVTGIEHDFIKHTIKLPIT